MGGVTNGAVAKDPDALYVSIDEIKAKRLRRIGGCR